MGVMVLMVKTVLKLLAVEFGMTIHAKLQEILCALMSFKDGLWPLLITRNNHVLLDSLCSMMLAMPLVPLRSLMLKPLQLVNLWVPKLLNLLTCQVTNWCTIGFTAVSETMSHIGLESPETPTESKIILQTVEEVRRFKSFSFRSFGYATRSM